MKKLFAFVLSLILCLAPFCAFSQIWEGDGGQNIEEGIGFGDGGNGTIDWSDFDGEQCTVTFRDIENTYSQSAVVPVGLPSGYILESLSVPDKYGYDFLGWSTLGNYPSLITMPVTYTATETYYTVYTPKKHSVTYMLDNNIYYVAQNVPYGTSTIPLPPDPAYPDIPQNDALYYWQGLPSTMPAEDITVTAVYGIAYWGIDINQSTGEVTYLYRAQGMRPIFVDHANSHSIGNWDDTNTSWKSFICKIAKPCMLKSDGTIDYYLDIDDQRYKADGVTASDYNNTSYDGNAMVEFKKMYIKVTEPETNKIRVLFAEKQIDNDFHAYAFTRENGTEADNVYVGMFISTNVSGTIRSISGGSQVSTSYTNLEGMAELNGTGWGLEYFSLRNYINLLNVLVMKNLNVTVANNGGFGVAVPVGNKVTTTDFSSDASYPAFYCPNSSQTSVFKTFWISNYFTNDHVVKGIAYDFATSQWLYRNTPPYSFSDRTNYSSCASSGNINCNMSGAYNVALIDKMTTKDNLLFPYSEYISTSNDRSNNSITAYGNSLITKFSDKNMANYVCFGMHQMSVNTMNGYNNIWGMNLVNADNGYISGWNGVFKCSLVYMP